jgi:hypothetical protein
LSAHFAAWTDTVAEANSGDIPNGCGTFSWVLAVDTPPYVLFDPVTQIIGINHPPGELIGTTISVTIEGRLTVTDGGTIGPETVTVDITIPECSLSDGIVQYQG